jgi:hypothetical protein
MFTFEQLSYIIGNYFKQLRVLAVSHPFFEGYIVCGPRNGLNGSPPFVGADEFAINAFKNIHSLEELWFERDEISRRTHSSSIELSASNTENGDSQEDGIDANSSSQIEANLQRV